MCGVTPDMMLDYAPSEVAALVRGYHLRKLEADRMYRWMVAALLQPHSKRAIDPKKLIKLEGDDPKGRSGGSVREKLAEAEKIFELWDDQNVEWKIEGKGKK